MKGPRPWLKKWKMLSAQFAPRQRRFKKLRWLGFTTIFSGPELSYQQRIGGYITCFLVSFILSIGSFTRLFLLAKGNPTPFVVFYTLGNIMAIIGSLFLSGPKNQCKRMFDRTRIFATLFYFTSIFVTIFCAFYEGIPSNARVGIIILCIIVQWIVSTSVCLSALQQVTLRPCFGTPFPSFLTRATISAWCVAKVVKISARNSRAKGKYGCPPSPQRRPDTGVLFRLCDQRERDHVQEYQFGCARAIRISDPTLHTGPPFGAEAKLSLITETTILH